MRLDEVGGHAPCLATYIMCNGATHLILLDVKPHQYITKKICLKPELFLMSSSDLDIKQTSCAFGLDDKEN